MSQPYAPADLDIIEMPKMQNAVNWLVDWVNRRLSEGSHFITRGDEYRVAFGYDDFVHSYKYLKYWREHYQDIAALFRERGWIVVEYARHTERPISRDEEQPALGFKIAERLDD